MCVDFTYGLKLVSITYGLLLVGITYELLLMGITYGLMLPTDSSFVSKLLTSTLHTDFLSWIVCE